MPVPLETRFMSAKESFSLVAERKIPVAASNLTLVVCPVQSLY
jgi:hypothetical protein